jgi:hypothetical protein
VATRGIGFVYDFGSGVAAGMVVGVDTRGMCDECERFVVGVMVGAVVVATGCSTTLVQPPSKPLIAADRRICLIFIFGFWRPNCPDDFTDAHADQHTEECDSGDAF